MVKLSLSLVLWSTIWISTESSTPCHPFIKELNFTNCDKDGLRTEELTHVLDKTAHIISYETSTQCKDITHCSNDSLGTGHTLASGKNGGPSLQKTISVVLQLLLKVCQPFSECYVLLLVLKCV